MSFATDLIDGFPTCNKRTDEGLKLMGEMNTFLAKLASCRHDYQKAIAGIISLGQKKLVTEPALDGSCKTAVEALLKELEDTVAAEKAATDKIVEAASEFAKYRKENEPTRKKLSSDCDAIAKDLAATEDGVKKARNNYQSLAKDAEKQSQALQKAQVDPGVKSAKIAQMNQKKTQALEKARKAFGEYSDVVASANEHVTTVYTRDIPNKLAEFQQFEENRIRFFQETLRKYSSAMSEVPPALQTTSAALTEKVNAVDIAADITGFVTAHRTGHSQPAPYVVEPVPGIGTDGADGAGATGAPSAGPSAAPVAGAAAGGAGGSTVWGLTPEDASLSVEQKREKLEGQKQRLQQKIGAAEHQAEALERMSVAYAKDPQGKKRADQELATFHEGIAKDKAALEKVENELKSLGGDGGAAEPAEAKEDAPEEAGAFGGEGGEKAAEGQEVKVRALFTYEAQADNELSFNEGDEFVVTNQDPSGWWYAKIGDKEGFVAQNYVEVIA